jgi:hypothetical protein
MPCANRLLRGHNQEVKARCRPDRLAEITVREAGHRCARHRRRDHQTGRLDCPVTTPRATPAEIAA